jgi:DNA-binding LacI/PurR family transcriptional regulator
MERARERGYLLDVVLTHGLEIARIEDAIDLINDHGVVGIIATAQTDEMVEYLQEHVRNAPLVVDARFTAFPANASMNEYSGALAADHLLDLGHRRVGYVSGPRAWLAATGRMAGFVDRVVERGGEVLWTREGDWGADSGAAAWRGLTAAERAVTAVALGNDSMAMGLMSAAAADGRRVPDELSVVGNDDIHEARYLTPPLTTVAVEFEAEGRMLVDQLLGAVEPDVPPTEVAALPRLVARGSSAHR